MNHKHAGTEYLDGIKGCGCLLVLFGHFRGDFLMIPGIDSIFTHQAFSILSNGNWALNLYFLISAFIVASSIINKPVIDERDITKKMIKRYFRLAFPLMVQYCIIYIIQKCRWFYNIEAAAVLGSENTLGSYFTSSYTLVHVLKESLIGTLFNGEYSFNSVMWMMQILFIGYYIAILLAIIIKTVKKPYGGVILCGLTLGLLSINSQYTLFVAGVLAAYVDYKIRNIPNKDPIMYITSFSSIVLGCLLASYCTRIPMMIGDSTKSNVLLSWYLYSKIGAILFLFGVVCGRAVKRVMSHKIFLWLNCISFPVFMFHRVIEASVGSGAFLYAYRRLNAVEYATWAAWLSTIMVLVFLSLFYVKVIDPAINFLINGIMKRVF